MTYYLTAIFIGQYDDFAPPFFGFKRDRFSITVYGSHVLSGDSLLIPFPATLLEEPFSTALTGRPFLDERGS